MRNEHFLIIILCAIVFTTKSIIQIEPPSDIKSLAHKLILIKEPTESNLEQHSGKNNNILRNHENPKEDQTVQEVSNFIDFLHVGHSDPKPKKPDNSTSLETINPPIKDKDHDVKMDNQNPKSISDPNVNTTVDSEKNSLNNKETIINEEKKIENKNISNESSLDKMSPKIMDEKTKNLIIEDLKSLPKIEDLEVGQTKNNENVKKDENGELSIDLATIKSGVEENQNLDKNTDQNLILDAEKNNQKQQSEKTDIQNSLTKDHFIHVVVPKIEEKSQNPETSENNIKDDKIKDEVQIKNKNIENNSSIKEVKIEDQSIKKNDETSNESDEKHIEINNQSEGKTKEPSNQSDQKATENSEESENDNIDETVQQKEQREKEESAFGESYKELNESGLLKYKIKDGIIYDKTTEKNITYEKKTNDEKSEVHFLDGDSDYENNSTNHFQNIPMDNLDEDEISEIQESEQKNIEKTPKDEKIMSSEIKIDQSAKTSQNDILNEKLDSNDLNSGSIENPNNDELKDKLIDNSEQSKIEPEESQNVLTENIQKESEKDKLQTESIESISTIDNNTKSENDENKPENKIKTTIDENEEKDNKISDSLLKDELDKSIIEGQKIEKPEQETKITENIQNSDEKKRNLKNFVNFDKQIFSQKDDIFKILKDNIDFEQNQQKINPKTIELIELSKKSQNSIQSQTALKLIENNSNQKIFPRKTQRLKNRSRKHRQNRNQSHQNRRHNKKSKLRQNRRQKKKSKQRQNYPKKMKKEYFSTGANIKFLNNFLSSPLQKRTILDQRARLSYAKNPCDKLMYFSDQTKCNKMRRKYFKSIHFQNKRRDYYNPSLNFAFRSRHSSRLKNRFNNFRKKRGLPKFNQSNRPLANQNPGKQVIVHNNPFEEEVIKHSPDCGIFNWEKSQKLMKTFFFGIVYLLVLR